MYVYILIDRYTIQYGAMNRWGHEKKNSKSSKKKYD